MKFHFIQTAIKRLLAEGQYDKANDIFSTLRNELPELDKYKGFGYCAYCSKLLSDALSEQSVEHSLIVGNRFTNSKLATNCKTANIKLIDTFDDSVPYAKIKTALHNRNNLLPKNIGHVAVLIDNTVYDLTSGQFGLENMYSLDIFRDIWADTHTCSVIVDESNVEDFKITKITKKAQL